MATKKRTINKAVNKRDEDGSPEAPETVQLTPAQQQAVQEENSRAQVFLNNMQMNYLSNRVGELASENTHLREIIETLQARLQKHEDSEA
jgi:hypothetical protein